VELERAARRWSALLSQALLKAKAAAAATSVSAEWAAGSMASSGGSRPAAGGRVGEAAGSGEAAGRRREAASPGLDRDRQLFSLLRRSSTRRSLAKNFAASAPSVPRAAA
jgi:hypothetical protein